MRTIKGDLFKIVKEGIIIQQVNCMDVMALVSQKLSLKTIRISNQPTTTIVKKTPWWIVSIMHN